MSIELLQKRATKAVSHLEKIINLLISIKNPPYFLYHTFHYLNIFIPKCLANTICKLNRNVNVDTIELETYDGSGQAVHPDVTFFHGEYWMVVTPYPYGMEEYENPCIYNGMSLNEMKPAFAPIVKQSKHKQGCHLSDPCIANNGKKLFCFYRESERIKGEKEKNTLLVIRYDEEKNIWTEPKEIISSEDDALLSPAFLFDRGGACHMYYVSKVNGQFSLVHSILTESIKVFESKNIEVEGIPADFNLWHIGIVYRDSRDKQKFDSDLLEGLFLLKSKDKKFKLFVSESKGNGESWNLADEITIPADMEDRISFYYKSCFIPGKSKLLLSCADTKRRYLLFESSKIYNSCP